MINTKELLINNINSTQISLSNLLKEAEFIEELYRDTNSINILYLNKKTNTKFIAAFKSKFLGYSEDSDITHLIKNSNKSSSEVIKQETLIHDNDVFLKYNSCLNSYTASEVEIILSEKYIDKYRTRKYVLIQETPQIYIEKIKPYIDNLETDKFITNILFNNTETIFYKEKDFVIVKDYKYLDDCDVYYLGIVYDTKIRSIRDLDSNHLDVLERMLYAKNHIAELVNKKLNKEHIKGDNIQCFLHYYPSFYTLHIHYVSLNLETKSNNINRAFDLFDVINNIKANENYYKNCVFNLAIDTKGKISNILNS